MCGIVGLYLKNKAWENKIGELFAPMLIAMTVLASLYMVMKSPMA